MKEWELGFPLKQRLKVTQTGPIIIPVISVDNKDKYWSKKGREYSLPNGKNIIACISYLSFECLVLSIIVLLHLTGKEEQSWMYKYRGEVPYKNDEGACRTF